MSSGKHSPMGGFFWRGIITSNLDKLVEIWDIENGEAISRIYNVEEVSNFYGDSEDYERSRIKISKQ